MGAETKIEWCHATFNCWRGCSKVSAGCANCYAETLSGRNPGTLGVWGPNGTRVVASESMWREPLKWDEAAAKAGERHRVFCASLADVFEDWKGQVVTSKGLPFWWSGGSLSNSPVPSDGTGFTRWATMDDIRERLFGLIDETPHLDWLLLTKRPENVLRMTFDAWCKKVPGHVSQNEGDGRRWAFPTNVWVGTSVENQATADERIPHLLRVPAKVRFLSMEPLLAPVRIDEVLVPHGDGQAVVCPLTGEWAPREPSPVGGGVLHWVIVGGESGPGARPFDVGWATSLIGQCRAAGVPVFVKQYGGNPVNLTDPLRLRDKKGGDWSEWPEMHRVREFPEVA